MITLSDRIDELCSSGVSYLPLKELGRRNKGINITAGQMRKLHKDNEEIRIFAGGKTFADVGRNDVPSAGIILEPSIIVKSRGNIGFEYYERPFAHKSEIWSYTLLDPRVDQKFVFYYLQSHERYFQLKAKSGKLPQISVRDTDEFEIPIPPMEVQREIVRVLDAFNDLERNLGTELELREKQFNHVRGLLVEVSQQTGAAKISLRDAESTGLVTMGRGMVISKKKLAALPGNYPVYSSSGLGNGEFGRYGDYMFDDERITWSIDGGGRLFYRPPHRYSVTNVSGWMTVNQPRLLVKYLYHVLLCQWEQERFDYTRKAHPSVIRDVYSFSIPSLATQEQVVAQLDAFETLIASIKQEIDLRQKQYSYYRDQLLSLAPKKA